MEKIVFIGGLTGSGKTDLAVKLAKQFNGELINADSRQIYKYLDIGTNKGEVTTATQGSFIDGVRIHLISFLDPDQRYSVYDFKIDALKTIEDILSRGKLPIIIGGTGLYIDSIIKDYQLTENVNADLRKELEAKDLAELQNMLIKSFPKSFDKLNLSDKANKRRLVRLIEKLTSVIIENPANKELKYEYLFLYPQYNWPELAKKIEIRVEQMFAEGLIEETKKTLDLGFSKDSIALQGIGYRQVISYLDGDITLQECIELVKIAHRQYAKRQKTWFEGKSRNYNLTPVNNFEEAKKAIDTFL